MVQALFDELIDLPPEEQAHSLNQAAHSAEIIAAARNLLLSARGDGIMDLAPAPLRADQEGTVKLTSN